ncbi:MAG: 1-deoxy-D-xylulose-5-phosphate reductoisomerase [Alphaproteobacteria bacterium]
MKISIFGSTGSIGTQTIDIVKVYPEKFKIVVLTAHKNVHLLIKQALDILPKKVVIGDEKFYPTLKGALSGTKIEISTGEEELLNAVDIKTDCIVSAIIGSAGLKITYKAIQKGLRVALANKESLVIAGDLINKAIKKYKATVIPIDSEHSSLFQLLENKPREQLESVILTASGGPFLNKKEEELKHITPKEAVKHPNWSMGAKISVDSATLMNKALEIIEAHYLFSIPFDNIDAVIHKESIVHALATWCDGSLTAHLSVPDMRIPILYALTWPKRLKSHIKSFSFNDIRNLHFEPICHKRFETINLAKEALRNNKTLVLNAANEIAVNAFLQKEIAFLDIIPLVRKILEREFMVISSENIDDVLEYHLEIEEKTKRDIKRYQQK